MYDGQLEYWVILKEKGQRKESVCEEERRSSKEAEQLKHKRTVT